jgi:hypothetical protein
MTDNERAEFLSNLTEEELYDLPCGGGIVTSQRWAIDALKAKYGMEGVRQRCLELLTAPRNGGTEPLSPDAAFALEGVLYHCGNRAALARLIEHHRGEVAAGRRSTDGYGQSVSGPNQRLIAALCRRLHMRLPAGIPRLTCWQVLEIFHSMSGLEPWWLLVLVLIVGPPLAVAYWIADLMISFTQRMRGAR